MKKLTGFLQRTKTIITRDFLLKTGTFFVIMMAVYLYLIFAGMAGTPEFTYAEF